MLCGEEGRGGGLQADVSVQLEEQQGWSSTRACVRCRCVAAPPLSLHHQHSTAIGHVPYMPKARVVRALFH